MPNARKFFTPEKKERIVAAIREAEGHTSGEIRVHLEERDLGDPWKRAVQVFNQLGMAKTAQRNGVLFYLAIGDHHFTILGDEGINAKVPEGFWDQIKQTMEAHFREGRFTEGLCEGILMAGKALKQYFPYEDKHDLNELDDNISFRDA